MKVNSQAIFHHSELHPTEDKKQ